MVINGDIRCDYEFDNGFDLKGKLAHLILVPNPPHNSNGDFSLKNGIVNNGNKELFTFSGIGYYSPKLFKGLKPIKSALAPLLRKAAQNGDIGGSLYKGVWHDVGTPQRLKDLATL